MLNIAVCTLTNKLKTTFKSTCKTFHIFLQNKIAIEDKVLYNFSPYFAIYCLALFFYSLTYIKIFPGKRSNLFAIAQLQKRYPIIWKMHGAIWSRQVSCFILSVTLIKSTIISNGFCRVSLILSWQLYFGHAIFDYTMSTKVLLREKNFQLFCFYVWKETKTHVLLTWYL